jgi:hypothetical protein
MLAYQKKREDTEPSVVVTPWRRIRIAGAFLLLLIFLLVALKNNFYQKLVDLTAKPPAYPQEWHALSPEQFKTSMICITNKLDGEIQNLSNGIDTSLHQSVDTTIQKKIIQLETIHDKIYYRKNVLALFMSMLDKGEIDPNALDEQVIQIKEEVADILDKGNYTYRIEDCQN